MDMDMSMTLKVGSALADLSDHLLQGAGVEQ